MYIIKYNNLKSYYAISNIQKIQIYLLSFTKECRSVSFQGLNKKKFKDYQKIVVVRNPWDRMVSRYFYSKKISAKFKDVTFDEFVNFDIRNNMYVLNQYRFCTKDKTNFCIDKIIKFENLNNDFDEVSLGIFGKKGLLKHSNSTEYGKYRDYYNAELKDKIYSNFKKDLNFFDYEF